MDGSFSYKPSSEMLSPIEVISGIYRRIYNRKKCSTKYGYATGVQTTISFIRMLKKNQNPFLILMTFGAVTVIIPELRQAEVNAVNITRRCQMGALSWVSV